MPANAQFVSVAERLIAFDTVSRNSNLELIAAAKETLASAGADIRFTYDRDRSKANLFATIGPEKHGGLVLSGHTDVVPVDGQEWSSDPFTPVIREGQLYGRGAADMKGFLAVALALAPEFAWAHRLRSLALHETGDHDGAIAAAHESIRLEPEEWQGYACLSHALVRVPARWREAIKQRPAVQAGVDLGKELRRSAPPSDEERRVLFNQTARDVPRQQ